MSLDLLRHHLFLRNSLYRKDHYFFIRGTFEALSFVIFTGGDLKFLHFESLFDLTCTLSAHFENKIFEVISNLPINHTVLLVH